MSTKTILATLARRASQANGELLTLNSNLGLRTFSLIPIPKLRGRISPENIFLPRLPALLLASESCSWSAQRPDCVATHLQLTGFGHFSA